MDEPINLMMVLKVLITEKYKNLRVEQLVTAELPKKYETAHVGKIILTVPLIFDDTVFEVKSPEEDEVGFIGIGGVLLWDPAEKNLIDLEGDRVKKKWTILKVMEPGFLEKLTTHLDVWEHLYDAS